MFRSVYCLCVNVYCTIATGCQPNCCYIYIYIILVVHCCPGNARMGSLCTVVVLQNTPVLLSTI
jgi:hypothetical protein